MNRRLIDFLPLLLLTLVTACSSTPTGVSSIEIGGGDRTTAPGSDTVLTAFVQAAEGISQSVTWTSSDTSVATVDADGLVSALAAGATSITATSVYDTAKSDSVTVTVELDANAPQTFDGSYAGPDGADPVLGVALYFEEPDPVIVELSFTEVFEGVFFGPVSPVGVDGQVELILPDTSEIPAEIIRIAGNFVVEIPSLLDCDLTASAPTVPVSYASLDPFENPAAAAISTGEAFPLRLLDEPLDPDTMTVADFLAAGHLFFVYAEAAVSVTSTGEGCDTPGETVSVDVVLEPGWNLLVHEYVIESESIVGVSISNSDAEEMFIINWSVL